uniref:Secreted protein containing Staphylococcal nuclease (SNase-like) domain protein n=1 Tax=uncultured organism TaxID=155900 RepID=M1PVE8_9ZZZZ|nr:secreted protein containing Staphylococcal nuclease (SNase-like) domain protein [uncultured organism]
MKKKISLLVLSLVLIFAITVTATELKEAEVVRVIDGDTLEARLKVGTAKIRYIGIDTPETHGKVERYGKEASGYNKSLVGDKTVWLEIGEEARDKYGRLLAYVYLDPAKKSMVNAILAAQGYAEVMTIPPNVKFADTFKELVKNAREGNRGLWSEEDSEQNNSEPVTGAGSCIEVLNNTSQEGFEDISGIGEGIAERLVNAQPFGPCKSVGCIKTDLREVSYVGKGRADDLLEHLCPEIIE